jgi:hypothetical protein
VSTVLLNNNAITAVPVNVPGFLPWLIFYDSNDNCGPAGCLKDLSLRAKQSKK